MIASADSVARLRGRWSEAHLVGILGILLGVLATWVALPPALTRTIAVPIVIGALAVGAGAWTISRGLYRLGGGAVAAGVLGIALGALAVQASEANLRVVFVWSALVAATLRWAAPLAFAAIGGMFSERSGVVNIGLEGMMLMGAFFGAWGADKTHSWVGGIAIAIFFGAALAFVHALFAIHLRADQIVSGTAVNFLALGITGYLYNDLYGNEGTPPGLPAIPDVSIPGLRDVYFIGPAFGDLNLMIWIMFGVLILSYVVMFKTPLGLRIRSVGEHPRAADTVGIPVYRVRYGAVLTSGALAALGGAYLALGDVHSFTENMTAGRGFIALAALIFGKWRPFGAFAAALLFGFSSALGNKLPAFGGNTESAGSLATIFNILPYVLTLIAVAGIVGRSIPPAAIGRPYKKQ